MDSNYWKLTILFVFLSSMAYGQDIGTVDRLTRTISVKDQTEAEKKAAYKYADSEKLYNATTKELTFKVNKVGPKLSWRLVHDKVNVIALFHSKGVTTSIYAIFEADSAAKCLAEIDRLHLIDNREVKEEEFSKGESK